VITRNVLLYQRGDELELRATDLEVYARTRLTVLPQGGSDPHVQIAIQPKPLSDLLKALPDDEVLTFTQGSAVAGVGEAPQLQVSSSFGRYDLAGIDAAEFPAFPEPPATQGMNFTVATLREIIQRTAFAAARDETRPALTGIYFHFLPDRTNFVATDAHVLVRLSRTDIALQNAPNLLLPVRALDALESAIKTFDPADELALIPAQEQAFFHHPALDLSCRLIEYSFPDYQAVIPSNTSYTARLSKEKLRKALKRLLVFNVTLTAYDALSHTSAVEYFPCEYEGADFKIAFRGPTLASILENIEAEEIVMRMTSPSRPVIIEPDPQLPPTDTLVLIMPVLQ
jgi:DNA polymerase-3 subunit beta